MNGNPFFDLQCAHGLPLLAVAKLPSFLPGMGFKMKARRWRQQYFSLAEEGHQRVKDDIVGQLACSNLALADVLSAAG